MPRFPRDFLESGDYQEKVIGQLIMHSNLINKESWPETCMHIYHLSATAERLITRTLLIRLKSYLIGEVVKFKIRLDKPALACSQILFDDGALVNRSLQNFRQLCNIARLPKYMHYTILHKILWDVKIIGILKEVWSGHNIQSYRQITHVPLTIYKSQSNGS